MKILCAPDSYKETLSAAEAAQAMAAGARRARPEIACDLCPVADGGEGTMQTLAAPLRGKILSAVVTGACATPVRANYAIGGAKDIAIVELAQASGLALVPIEQRDPTRTTTFGTGELIRIAASQGCRTIVVCIGGSATVDGGAGIAQALGAKFWDRNGKLIEQPLTGGLLRSISRFQPPPHLPPEMALQLRVACDVTNPLCGPSGAAAVYGPQKGATPAQVRDLDQALAHLAQIVGGDPNQPGAGAAGGAGFGLVNMCGAKLQSGIELVLEAVQFEQRCADATLVLTGEGRLDAQSLQGKACMGVAAAAAKLGVPTIAIVGSTGQGAEDCINPDKGGMLKSYVSLADQFGLQAALARPAQCVEEVAREITRDWMH